MKSKKIILFAIAIIFAFSCKKEDKFNLQGNYLGTEVSGKTPIDTFLYTNFVQPYNIEVKYKWDQSLFDMQYTLVPPQQNMVVPFMDVVKKTWIEPYNTTTGNKQFIQINAPKQLILSGSPEFESNGSQVAGVAEGGLAILLTNVNGIDVKGAQVTEVLHVINHEFTHILNQKKAYSTQFVNVTPGDYTSNWNLIKVTDNPNILGLGFISTYARKSDIEDFAEMTSLMLTWGKDGYENYIHSQDVVDFSQYPVGTLKKIIDFSNAGNVAIYMSAIRNKLTGIDPKAIDTFITQITGLLNNAKTEKDRQSVVAQINTQLKVSNSFALMTADQVSQLQLIVDLNDPDNIKLMPFKTKTNPAYAAGIAKLRQKEAIVVSYFKSAYNIDFYSLQTQVQIALANARK